MIAKKALVLALFFIAITPFVFSAEPITVLNPYPLFSVEYLESNAPISISEVFLTDDLDNQYKLIGPVVNDKDNPWIFNYSSKYYLLNNHYNFQIYAEDVSKNPRQDIFSINIAVDQMPIYVHSPLSPLFANDDKQDFAVGNSTPFEMELHTAGPATCRIKSHSLATRSSEEEWSSSSREFNEGSLVEVFSHNMTLISTSSNDNFLLPISALNYDNLFDNSFLVICQQDADPEPTYHMKIIYAGYDSSPPSQTVSFDPPLIEDFSDVSTVMYVATTGDLVACSYILTQPNEIVQGNLPQTVNSFTDLFSSTTKNFTFNNIRTNFVFGQRYNFSVVVNCTNPAGLWSITEGNFAVQLSTVLRMSLSETHFSNTKPTITLTTNLAADCWYTEGSNTTPLVTTDGLSHVISDKTFVNGNNDLSITCKADQAGLETHTYRIVIDTLKPLAPIIGSGTDYCKSRLSLLLLAPEPEDDVRYNVSLYNSSTLSDENRIYGPELTSFTDDDLNVKISRSVKTYQNSSYTWKVYAIDRAENAGPTAKHTMKRVSPDSITCDFTPPFVNVDLEKTDAGYEINISCKDAESGCTDTYRLSQIATNMTCNYSKGLPTLYTSNPLNFTEDIKLCYTIMDRADNEKTGKVKLTLDAQQQIEQDCTNGYKDLDEEGIDCGGVCGSDNPCPEKVIDEFIAGEDNETVEDEDDESIEDYEFECYDDFDCGFNEVCTSNECVASEKESSFLGLLLLILGTVFMVGGIGYIVYAENKKEEYNKQKALHQEQNSQTSAEMAAKQLANEKKYLEELKRKHEAGEEKKSHLSQEKKDERSKILGEFDTEEDETSRQSESEKVEEKDKPLFTPHEEELEVKKITDEEKEPAKLDEGLEGDFVDVEKLGKKETDLGKEEEKDAFDDLKKINEKQKKKNDEESTD